VDWNDEAAMPSYILPVDDLLDSDLSEDSQSIMSSDYADSFASSEIALRLPSVNKATSATSSEGSSLLGTVLRTKKTDVIGQAIRWFNGRLTSGLAVLAYQNGESSTAAPRSGLSCPGNNRANQKAQAGKRTPGGFDDEDQSGSEEARHNSPIELKGRKRLRPNRKLACPFFKHDPELYNDRRTCTGPGWITVHRVKFVILLASSFKVYTDSPQRASLPTAP
jgi:hypothetical protein